MIKTVKKEVAQLYLFLILISISTSTLFLSLSCTEKGVGTKGPANPRLSSDTRGKFPLVFSAVYPAWNTKIAPTYANNNNVNYYYTLKKDGMSIEHKVEIYNLYNSNYSLQWFVDGIEIDDAIQNLFEVSPSLFTEAPLVGEHYVKVQLFDENEVVVDSRIWLIVIID